MNSNDELRRHLRALALDEPCAAGARTGHLDDETLIDFQQGRLPAEARWEARLHLELCAQCGERLIDVEDFFVPPRADESELSDFEVRQQWKELAARLPFVERAAEVAERSSFWQRLAVRLQSPPTLAFAACALLLTTLLAGIFAYKLGERRARQAILAQLRTGQVQMTSHIGTGATTLPANSATESAAPLVLPQPQANTPVFTIPLAKPQPSGEAAREPYFAGIPANAAFFTINVLLGEDAYQTYALEFAAPDGSIAWRQDGLRPDDRVLSDADKPSRAAAKLNLSMPKQLLGEGKFIFRIYGQGARTVLLKEYDWSLDLPH